MTLSISRGPLGKLEKFLLILSTAATVLTCYLFSLLSIALLLLLVAAEILLMIVLIRFGLARLMSGMIQRHLALIGIFVRNLWLRKGVAYQMPLAREDAPRLFAMLDALADRFKIAPPNQVLIEMNCGAWVRMHGYRSGRGRTILGIGYDLLATLNLSEFEAVMAHEMAHAKLVKRGLKSWLNGGLARIARVSHALDECVEAYRAQKVDFVFAAFFETCSDRMARLAARLVTAYSRQDEFEADRGAAELCGAWPLRTSLLRLDAVEARLARLPWAERVSRIETEASFSHWLTQELIVPESETQHPVTEEARDPYSTHPSLHDRLAALPSVEADSQDPTLALTLLSHPDKIAATLIEEIHRVVAAQEEKDFQLLAKAVRKTQGSAQLNWAHLPGLILIFLAVVTLVVFLMDLSNWSSLIASLVTGVLGVWLFRLVRYRDRRTLPVPRFADLKKAWLAPIPSDLKEREKQIESEFVSRGSKKKSQRLEFLLEEAFGALGRCEYLRAHVATRIALQINNKSVEAALGHAIASASLGLRPQVGNLLTFVRKKAGLSSPQIVWGAAWAFALSGDWSNAEAFLWKKHQEAPGEPTFLLLLALAQQQRGKLQSAIAHAEKALALTPEDVEARKLLCQCLLDAGRLHAAAEQLGPLEPAAKTDPELIILMIRLKLLQQNLASAQEWAGYFHEDGKVASLIQLGEMFEHARQDQLASGYFDRAIEQGFYPEAQVGLARIAARQKEWSRSRRHLLSALNLEIPPPVGAKGPAQLFHSVVNHLMQLDRMREQCRAWVVEFPTGQSETTPPVLRGCRLMVFGPTRVAAVGYLEEILQAMQPGVSSAKAADLRWTDAPKDRQPERPAYPGVQGVL